MNLISNPQDDDASQRDQESGIVPDQPAPGNPVPNPSNASQESEVSQQRKRDEFEQKRKRLTDRLEESKKRWEQQEFDTGFETGSRWSQEKADYADLRDLNLLWDSLASHSHNERDRFFEEDDNVSGIVGSAIACGFHSSVDHNEASEFWESLGVEEPISEQWVKGFCLGALEVFEP